MIIKENQSATKRIMSQIPVEYPLPVHLATSVYKNDFLNADIKAKKNLRVPTCNYEVEANRIFSDVK